MKKKLLCGILAGLLLLSSVTATACTGGNETGDNQAGSNPDSTGSTVSLPDSTPVSEAPTEPFTEAVTEPESEPPIEITVPPYEDIGLIDKLAGSDERVRLEYPFDRMSESLSQIKADSQLIFTTNGEITKDANGITASQSVWNAMGFGAAPVGTYVAEATLFNHGDSTSATSSVMFGTRLQSAKHLFVDSGLWVSVNNGNAHLIIHGVLNISLGKNMDFDAKKGVTVRFEDSGDEIAVYVADQHLATIRVDSQANSRANTFTVFDPEGVELQSGAADRIAHGDNPGYIRAMQHFAPSSVASMSLSYGTESPYAPADTVTELRDGLSYLLCEKTQYRCGYPITRKENVTLLDAKAVAELFGFTYAENGTAVTLSRDAATLTFTAGENAVVCNGQSFPFPTVVKRGDTTLIAVDYFARWMGYTVKAEGDSVYMSGNENNLTKAKVQEMDERYQLYHDIIYNHDDVEIEKIGVGEFEKTPYEDRLVGIAYTTWHCPSMIDWGKNTWDTPLHGIYNSDDPDRIALHAELLRDAGIDFIFVDWTNNTCYDPETMREQRADFRMIEEATDRLFEIWSQIEGAPKICIFAGPGHSGPENVSNGNHQKKVDQIYRDYVEKYPDLYFHYEGKPLLMCYGATPNLYGPRPRWTDDRFTIRWATGYVGQQGNLFNSDNMSTRGWWSWEERGLQTYSVLNGRVECVTCTAASRSQGKEGDSDYIPAYGRDNGMTLKKQFQRANDLGAGMVILISWNEWTTGEQPSPEVSKDLEPSNIHGTFYYDLLCEQIKKFKGQLTESPD